MSTLIPTNLKAQNIYVFLLCLFGLGFPFYAWFGNWCLLTLAVVWIVNNLISFGGFQMKSLHWMMLIYFLLHVFGLLYSEDLSAGIVDIKSKAALLILPVFLANISFSKKDIMKIIGFFVTGTVITNLIYLAYAAFQYFYLNTKVDVFFYSELTTPFYNHPAYIASYNIFALVVFIYFLFKQKVLSASYKWAYLFCAVAMWFMVILYASRMQILVMCFVASAIFIWNFGVGKKWFITAITILGFCTLTFLTANSFEVIKERVQNAMGNIENQENVRFDLWESAWNISQENPILGVGTGDVQVELEKEYKRNDYEKALKNNLNAHNQYLQSMVSLGIFGLLSYLLLMLWPSYRALNVQNIIVLSFYLIFILGTLTECMLETQRGTVWLAVFGSLFWQREDFLDEAT